MGGARTTQSGQAPNVLDTSPPMPTIAREIFLNSDSDTSEGEIEEATVYGEVETVHSLSTHGPSPQDVRTASIFNAFSDARISEQLTSGSAPVTVPNVLSHDNTSANVSTYEVRNPDAAAAARTYCHKCSSEHPPPPCVHPALGREPEETSEADLNLDDHYDELRDFFPQMMYYLKPLKVIIN